VVVLAVLPHLIKVLMSLEPLISAFVIYSVGQIQQYQIIEGDCFFGCLATEWVGC